MCLDLDLILSQKVSWIFIATVAAIITLEKRQQRQRKESLNEEKCICRQLKLWIDETDAGHFWWKFHFTNKRWCIRAGRLSDVLCNDKNDSMSPGNPV